MAFVIRGAVKTVLNRPESIELLSIQSLINHIGRNHREKGTCWFVLCVYTLICTHLAARTHPFLASRNRDGERYRDPRRSRSPKTLRRVVFDLIDASTVSCMWPPR